MKKIYQEMPDEKISKEVFKRNEYKKEAFELLLEEARKRIIEDEEERRKIFGEEESKRIIPLETHQKNERMKEDTFILNHIKRTNRNLLLTNIFVIVGIVLMWLWGFFYGAGYFGLAIFGLIILSFYNIVKFWKRNKNSLLHPISIVLARFGQPQKIADIINEEVKASKLHIKSIIVTESWLLKPSMYGLEVILLGELAWVYKKLTQHSINFIPTNKSFAVVIYKRDGKSLEVSCSELCSDGLIKEVMKSVPWVVGGFNVEIQNFWNTDRNGFIAYVDQRKLEINMGIKNSQK